MKKSCTIAYLALGILGCASGYAHAGSDEDDYESFRTSSTELKAINIAAKECDRHFKRKILYNILVSKNDGEFSVSCSDPARTQTIIIEAPLGPVRWVRNPGAPVFVIDLKTMKIVDRHFSRD